MRINKTDIIVDIKYGDLKGYKGISLGYLNGINYWISNWIYDIICFGYKRIFWDIIGLISWILVGISFVDIYQDKYGYNKIM
jgi:hypothetical protein